MQIFHLVLSACRVIILSCYPLEQPMVNRKARFKVCMNLNVRCGFRCRCNAGSGILQSTHLRGVDFPQERLTWQRSIASMQVLLHCHPIRSLVVSRQQAATDSQQPASPVRTFQISQIHLIGLQHSCTVFTKLIPAGILFSNWHAAARQGGHTQQVTNRQR